MDVSHDLNKSSNRFSTFTYVQLIIRVVTGTLLGMKGFYFIRNADVLRDMVLKTAFNSKADFFVNYITFAHMFGGAFIILGLLTRFAVFLQLPVLLAAIFYGLGTAHVATTTEAIWSVVNLLLLIFILVKGPGKISMDYYLKRHKL